MGTGAHVTSAGAHPQYERCPPAIITGANTYKYSDDDAVEGGEPVGDGACRALWQA